MSSVGEQKVQDGSLKRELGERHIRLMALGACIGVGLFLGSAKAIQMAGPAIMISYILGGLAILVIMRALGEMAVHNPVAGSFSQYAKDYLGPLAGFITGWNYWFLWLVTCVAEITAVAVYMGIWFPDVPRWIWALAALASMGTINLIAVRAFGEFEFWFALIKIVTILAMVVVGIGMIAFGFGNDGIATGISNLWAHGGFMPNGIQGVLMSLQMVMFAYLGVEMIGLTAGEARNPTKTIPSAINSVFWRILLFYVGSLFVIMSLYPWNEIGTQGSPFVMTFERMGIKTAAGIINFVVITAALSSCNGGIFSTGRMLWPGPASPGPGLLRQGLAQRRTAPGADPVDPGAAAGRVAELPGAGEGIRLGDFHRHLRRDLDLGDDPAGPVALPQDAQPGRVRQAAIPHVAVPGQFLPGAGVPGDGGGADGLLRGHPHRPLHRPAVHPAADRPVLCLQPGAEGACRHRLGKPRGVLSGVAPERKGPRTRPFSLRRYPVRCIRRITPLALFALPRLGHQPASMLSITAASRPTYTRACSASGIRPISGVARRMPSQPPPARVAKASRSM